MSGSPATGAHAAGWFSETASSSDAVRAANEPASRNKARSGHALEERSIVSNQQMAPLDAAIRAAFGQGEPPAGTASEPLKWSTLAFVGAFAVLGVDPASAQSAAEKPEAVLPEVKVRDTREASDSTSTATRTDTPLRDIPQFINVVPQALIRSQGATTLVDALRNVPGISYAAAEGGTQANQVFYLRGFPVNGDIFLDGVRDLGEYNRDLFATEGVEVLKGPSSLMFGRGSPGGVINQVSKVADLSTRKEVALQLGSFSQKRLTADLNLPTTADDAFRIVALAEDSGSYRYPQDVRKLGVAPSYRWGIGQRTDVSIAYTYLKTDDVTDYGQPTLTPAVTGTPQFAMPPISPRNDYGFANHDFTEHETHIATARIDHRFGDALSLRNTLRWANYQRQVEATIATLRATDANNQPVTPATPLDLLMVTRNHDGGRTRDNDDDALINQTELTWRVAGGGIRHTVLAGLELSAEKLRRWNYALDADPALPGVQIPTAPTPLLAPDPGTPLSYTKTPNVRTRAEADAVSVYVQDQLEFTSEWKALLGLRWERYAAEARTESYLTGAIATGPFERTDSMLSGRAGLIWQPGETQSYYIAAGNSFNPSGELGVYGATGTNLSAINAGLEPEENRSFEIGGAWDFADVQVRGSIFRNEKINARMNDPLLGTTVLAGKRRVDGIELQLLGRIRPDWDIYGALALMDSEIVKGPANVQGKVPLGVPDLAGNVWTVYRIGRGFEVGGGLRYSSSFWLNDANTGEVPGYTVLDATAAYVQRNYEIRVNLFNLTDKTYYVGGYNNTPNRVLPGAPLSASVGLLYRFD
jgi:catecholate siderophore receptor